MVPRVEMTSPLRRRDAYIHSFTFTLWVSKAGGGYVRGVHGTAEVPFLLECFAKRLFGSWRTDNSNSCNDHTYVGSSAQCEWAVGMFQGLARLQGIPTPSLVVPYARVWLPRLNIAPTTPIYPTNKGSRDIQIFIPINSTFSELTSRYGSKKRHLHLVPRHPEWNEQTHGSDSIPHYEPATMGHPVL